MTRIPGIPTNFRPDNIIVPGNGFGLDTITRLLEATSKTVITFLGGTNGIPIKIGNEWFYVNADIPITIADALDTGSISNGVDYYVYACDNNGVLVFKVSLNSTNPSGFTTSNSRKIGGFHTLCTNVGSIGGHTLTGYVANDILPQSIWDLKHRPICDPEGMVYSDDIHKWVDIYLASGTGASTVSVNGGTISDTRDWMDFVDDGHAVKKRLLDDDEFQAIAAGSNEETNVSGSSDPVTTGGHSDTNARRMISNIGCEDCCGALWQWLRTSSARLDDSTAAGWINLAGAKGSFYTYGTNGYGNTQLLAGGAWNVGASCGSRGRHAESPRWDSATSFGGRFIGEPI